MYLLLVGNEISAYTTEPNVLAGTITVSDDIVPEDMTVDFEPGKWIYEDNVIKPNPNYIELPKFVEDPIDQDEMLLDLEYRVSLLELNN